MQIGRSRRSGSYSQLLSADRTVVVVRETNGFSSSSSASSTSALLSSSHPFSSARPTACVSYIEHRVSKMDTLAGVAIKYGVEVADIRRLNALVTDRQMFAHKSIKIPLPGRHPPSSIMSNGSACNGYSSAPALSLTSRSLVNGFPLENGDAAQATDFSDENGEIDRSNSDKSIRRRQKIDADLPCRAPELLKEEDATMSGRTGKSIAPRPRSGSRTDLDSSFMTAISSGDSFIVNGSVPVRKSSSTSNLQEPENGSSTWSASKWSLKPDVIAKPLFDGFPKPMAVWRSKAALD
ncbi:hypothetical protein Taro_017081 [Colocasia esculenta]|uniref:LysM domain-containing protein n=1 Tax=Colocasia esculenta TaxID=4460 RepID=A0A843UFE5_COLES|nr:hypothetical protein [Colocasia esculenta]